MTLYAPSGLCITGTLERLQAQAMINQESAGFDQDGRVIFDYDGLTECFWDTQESVLRAKPSPAPYHPERVFLDEQGNEWFASQLTDIPPTHGEDHALAPAPADE